MFPMECINRGGETRSLPGKSRESEMAFATLHELRKQRTGITGRIFPLKNHVSAGWLETADPAAERRGPIEVGGTAELADEGHRKAPRSGVVERRTAVLKRCRSVGQRHQAGVGYIFLLHVDQHEAWRDRRIR